MLPETEFIAILILIIMAIGQLLYFTMLLKVLKKVTHITHMNITIVLFL